MVSNSRKQSTGDIKTCKEKILNVHKGGVVKKKRSIKIKASKKLRKIPGIRKDKIKKKINGIINNHQVEINSIVNKKRKKSKNKFKNECNKNVQVVNNNNNNDRKKKSRNKFKKDTVDNKLEWKITNLSSEHDSNKKNKTSNGDIEVNKTSKKRRYNKSETEQINSNSKKENLKTKDDENDCEIVCEVAVINISDNETDVQPANKTSNHKKKKLKKKQKNNTLCNTAKSTSNELSKIKKKSCNDAVIPDDMVNNNVDSLGLSPIKKDIIKQETKKKKKKLDAKGKIKHCDEAKSVALNAKIAKSLDREADNNNVDSLGLSPVRKDMIKKETKRKKKKVDAKAKIKHSDEAKSSALNAKTIQNLDREADVSKLVAPISLKKFDKQKLKTLFQESKKVKTTTSCTLKDKMLTKMKAAKFRMLNEKLYNVTGVEAKQLFAGDEDAFKTYHEGYQSQVAKWPVNPLSLIIEWLSSKPENWKVADFGCGEAKLSKSVSHKVISIDFVAATDDVITCDMANTPLKSNSCNAVVFCLSLMGTNIQDFILEANRVLVPGGALKIAEVESRFTNLKQFVDLIRTYGFKCVETNQDNEYFWILEFKKINNYIKTKFSPIITLQPCIYKKR